MRLFKNITFHLILSLVFMAFLVVKISAEEEEDNSSEKNVCTSVPECAEDKLDCDKCIERLNDKKNEVSAQAKTLSSEIAAMDQQINLTEARIAATSQQIEQLQGDIDITEDKIINSETDINDISKALLNRAKASYQYGNIEPWQIILTSSNIDNFFTRLKYLKMIQYYDQKNVLAAEQSRVNYSNQQNILNDKQNQAKALGLQLEAYSSQLEQEKSVKDQLLQETRGSEENYQRLLRQAQAQLAGFRRFVTSQGGASILSNQTHCDDWGCYYNQRDSQWGNNSLNGTQYSLASDGCLVTAMAMVYTHLGKKGVTPQTINSNPSNFASYYPAYLNKTISAEGMTTSRIYATIDSELNSGKPVIIGIGGGPDHFVVFVSGSNGDYTMHDPFIPNGHHIKFTDHYSISSINSIERISY